VVLAGVALVAATLLGMERWQDRDAEAPESIVAGDRELSLRRGRVFLYFFNPYCPHCLKAAQAMSRLEWQATEIGLPTQYFDQGPGFFQDAGMRQVALSREAAKLGESFPFKDVPFAVALEDGRVREKLRFFEEPQLGQTLRRIGFAR